MKDDKHVYDDGSNNGSMSITLMVSAEKVIILRFGVLGGR